MLYVPVSLQCVAQHRGVIAGLDIKGRIYISKQGINAQFSGPASDAVSYAQWVEAQPEFLVSLHTWRPCIRSLIMS